MSAHFVLKNRQVLKFIFAIQSGFDMWRAVRVDLFRMHVSVIHVIIQILPSAAACRGELMRELIPGWQSLIVSRADQEATNANASLP